MYVEAIYLIECASSKLVDAASHVTIIKSLINEIFIHKNISFYILDVTIYVTIHVTI